MSQEEKEREQSRCVAGVQGERWQLAVGSEGGDGEKQAGLHTVSMVTLPRHGSEFDT